MGKVKVLEYIIIYIVHTLTGQSSLEVNSENVLKKFSSKGKTKSRQKG